MAYNGTTALSSVANPPVRIGGYIGLGPNSTAVGAAGTWGRSLWLYNSSESSSDIAVAGYFTDAAKLGMKHRDIVMCICATGSSVGFAIGVLTTLTTAGAAALGSSGGFISSTR